MVVVMVAAVVVGVILVLGIVVAQRSADTQLGGPGQKSLLQEALYTGKPPNNIDRERWIAYLRRRRPHPKLVLHAAAVSVGLISVTVSGVREPGRYGADEFGDLVLLAFIFALIYGLRWRILRGSIGWDQPANQELLAALERENRESPRDQ